MRNLKFEIGYIIRIFIFKINKYSISIRNTAFLLGNQIFNKDITINSKPYAIFPVLYFAIDPKTSKIAYYLFDKLYSETLINLTNKLIVLHYLLGEGIFKWTNTTQLKFNT